MGAEVKDNRVSGCPPNADEEVSEALAQQSQKRAQVAISEVTVFIDKTAPFHLDTRFLDFSLSKHRAEP